MEQLGTKVAELGEIPNGTTMGTFAILVELLVRSSI